MLATKDAKYLFLFCWRLTRQKFSCHRHGTTILIIILFSLHSMRTLKCIELYKYHFPIITSHHQSPFLFFLSSPLSHVWGEMEMSGRLTLLFFSLTFQPIRSNLGWRNVLAQLHSTSLTFLSFPPFISGTPFDR